MKPVYLRNIDRMLFVQRRAVAGLWILACIAGCVVIGYCAAQGI